MGDHAAICAAGTRPHAAQSPEVIVHGARHERHADDLASTFEVTVDMRRACSQLGRRAPSTRAVLPSSARRAIATSDTPAGAPRRCARGDGVLHVRRGRLRQEPVGPLVETTKNDDLDVRLRRHVAGLSTSSSKRSTSTPTTTKRGCPMAHLRDDPRLAATDERILVGLTQARRRAPSGASAASTTGAGAGRHAIEHPVTVGLVYNVDASTGHDVRAAGARLAGRRLVRRELRRRRTGRRLEKKSAKRRRSRSSAKAELEGGEAAGPGRLRGVYAPHTALGLRIRTPWGPAGGLEAATKAKWHDGSRPIAATSSN